MKGNVVRGLSAVIVAAVALTIWVAWDFVASGSKYALDMFSPLFWIGGGFIAATLVALFALLRFSPQPVLLGALSFVIIGFGIVSLTDWNSRRPFLRDLRGVQPGMTAAEVDLIMGPYLRSHHSTGAESRTEFLSYRHTTAAWGNSDIGLVQIEDDRVSRVEFLPD